MKISKEQRDAEIAFMLGHGPNPNIEQLQHYEVRLLWGLIRLKIRPVYGKVWDRSRA